MLAAFGRTKRALASFALGLRVAHYKPALNHLVNPPQREGIEQSNIDTRKFL